MNRIFKVSHLINFAVLFILFYLSYHTINGQYNIQNYLINKFEKRIYEDFRYKLKQDAVAVNLDILALRC
jgi:cell division protein FtsB